MIGLPGVLAFFASRFRPRSHPKVGPVFRAPDWQWEQFGDVGWWVRPDWRQTLLSEQGELLFNDWKQQGRVNTIKTGPHREVVRIDLQHKSIYIKHFLLPSYREIFRQWIRRGKARNEAKRAIRLGAIGIRTVVPLALGERRKRKFLFDNYLITEAITNTTPLDQVLRPTSTTVKPPLPARSRRRLAESLGRLTARLHREGILQNDYHLGNLLVDNDTINDETPRLHLIDLDSLQFQPKVDWRRAAANLGQLCHASWIITSRADRLRFLHAYSEELGNKKNLRLLAAEIEQRRQRWAERLWTRRAKRCVRGRGEFRQVNRDRAWGIARRELGKPIAQRVLAHPEQFLTKDARCIKHSRTTTVSEIQLPFHDQGTVPVIAKQFHQKKKLEGLLSVVRPSRAWRAWLGSHHLQSRGIATAQDLIVIGRDTRQRRIRLPTGPTETFLFSRKLEPSVSLDEFIRSALPSLAPTRRLATIRSLAESLGRLIRTLHERSISHRDLKASNILLVGDPLEGPVQLHLIDLVGVQVIHPLPHHRRIQNLGRLGTSLVELPGWTYVDSLRILKSYLPGHSMPSDGWKPYWAEIQQWIERKQQRNAIRGRPIS